MWTGAHGTAQHAQQLPPYMQADGLVASPRLASSGDGERTGNARSIDRTPCAEPSSHDVKIRYVHTCPSSLSLLLVLPPLFVAVVVFLLVSVLNLVRASADVVLGVDAASPVRLRPNGADPSRSQSSRPPMSYCCDTLPKHTWYAMCDGVTSR